MLRSQINLYIGVPIIMLPMAVCRLSIRQFTFIRLPIFYIFQNLCFFAFFVYFPAIVPRCNFNRFSIRSGKRMLPEHCIISRCKNCYIFFHSLLIYGNFHIIDIHPCVRNAAVKRFLFVSYFICNRNASILIESIHKMAQPLIR